MKHLLLSLGLLCLCFMGQAQTYDFNNTSDLETYFSSGSSYFTNITSGGIGGTGCINVYKLSDIWTSKTSYEPDTIILSAFFYNYINNGYGGLGISASSSNNRGTYANSTSGLGVIFHAGGGMFMNDNVSTEISWEKSSGDLSTNAWYKMVLLIIKNASGTFDMKFQIWKSDANGNLKTMHTEQTVSEISNSTISSASAIYPYFSASGIRFSYMDNFSVAATIIAPVITSVAAPSDSLYAPGENLDFTVNYNEPVVVSGSLLLPITLNTGGNVSATYLSGSNSTSLVFRYTVKAGNGDIDGVTVGSAIQLNSGTIQSSLTGSSR